MSIQLAWAVTAHFKIAPSAISTIDVPIVIGRVYPRTCRLTHLSVAVAQLALDVARHLAFADRVAFVVHVLAAGQRDLDLGPGAVGEVDPRGDERQAALSRLA